MISMTNSRDREHPNPIFNDNTLKIGVFGFDAGNGCAVTMAQKRHILDRDCDPKMAQAADRMGFARATNNWLG